MNVCPSCGTLNPDSAKFCLECGTRLTPSQAIDIPSTPVDPVQPPVAESIDSEETSRPKKDVSGLPPSWMPAPVTLSGRPSGQRPVPARPILTPSPIPTTPPPPPPVAPVPEPDVADVDENDEVAESTSKDLSGLPPTWMPAPVKLDIPRPIERTGVDDDWKMSDAGPLPDRKDRRLFLWIPVGLIAAVLICCIAFFIWATTIGEDTVDGWATNAAVNQTEETTSGD
ncbi:hypothetical protein BH09CHL1_BH09CHL1_17280 [soil metagenome]